MLKKSFCAAILCGALFSVGAMAQTVTRTINLSATIGDPIDAFQILPLAGYWPSIDQLVTWSATEKKFSNPKLIGFKIKSGQDVSVALANTARLVDGKKVIPINVAIKAFDTGKGNNVEKLGLVGSKIYEKSKNTTGDFVSYDLEITASKDGMLDATGAVIAGADPAPAPGNYTGSVDLVFESIL